MNEKQVIVTLEDGFGRVQTSIATSLSAPQLMDKIMEIDEQQATISALKDIFKDIITYSEWDSKKPYCSLRIAVDKKTYYKIREILNE